METKFTKGEFHAVEFAGYWVIQTEPYYDKGVDLLDAERMGDEQAAANAKLFATAPELYEACQSALSLLNAHLTYADTKVMDELKAALKKAQ